MGPSSVAFSLLLLFLTLGLGGCQPPASQPSWTKSKVLATGEDHPSKILVDGSFVYYVTGGTVASQQEGTNNIKRLSLRDGSASVLVKGGPKIPDPVLALDEKFVYWTDGGNILRVPREGGESEIVIAGAPMPVEMLVDQENIYWLIWGGEGSPPQPLMFAPKQVGAATRQLAPPQAGANGLCMDETSVYWTTPRGINRVAKTGGETTLMYQNPVAEAATSGLAQDAENFYYCQMNSRGRSALMRLSKRGGGALELAPSINSTHDFVVDDLYVYYFADEPGGGSFGPTVIQKVAKTGGDPVALDKGEGGWLKFIAVDREQLYFTDIASVYALRK